MYRLFFKVCSTLTLITIVIVVALSFRISVNSSLGSAQVQPNQPDHTENMNTTKLNALLENKDLRVEESKLLPTRIERSQTILVRLKSDNLSDFATELSENAEVSLLQVKDESGPLSRQRVLEMSPSQILIVAVDQQNQVLWWNLQPDPRLIRAETSDDSGHLSGKTLYRQDADMLVSLPEDQLISEVRFYNPVWDGIGSYSLKDIGSLNMRSADGEKK